MNRIFALVGALSGLSCTELSARWNDHQVFFGSVRDVETGETLTTFCALTSVERSEVVVISAPAGATVEEEAFVEGRTEKYFGTAPERADTFWCSDAAKLYLRPSQPWVCLHAADDDPPATILAVEPRGEVGASGASSGYALRLQIQRPGVLRVKLDAKCLHQRFDAGPQPPDDDPDADPDAEAPDGEAPEAGAPAPWGELTIR